MASAALPLEVVRDPDSAAALLQPGRLRLLEHLAEPDSASGLARRLRLPRQKVNYHLRELEKHGFLELIEERRKGNCIERIVRATAHTYLISPEALGKLGATAEQRRDRFSAAWLVSTAARAIRDLAVLGVRAAQANKRFATLTLETEVRFRTASDRADFAQDLAATLVQLTARYHCDPSTGGRLFRFFIGGYPAITKQEETPAGVTARLG